MDLKCNLLQSLQHYGFDKYENRSYDSLFPEPISEPRALTAAVKATSSSFQVLPSVWLDIFVFVLLSCLALNYIIYSKHIAQWRKSNIPFLKPTFLIGDKRFLNLTKNAYLVSLDHIYKDAADKDAIGFFMGKSPMVLIRNPQLIRQVFVKSFHQTFESGWRGLGVGVDDATTPLVFDYLSDFDAWTLSRNTLRPAFSTSQVSAVHFDRIIKQLDNLWAHLDEAQTFGKPVRVKEISLNFAVDARSLWLYEQKINSYEQKTALHRVASSFHTVTLARTLHDVADIQFPGARWINKTFKMVAQRDLNEIYNTLYRKIPSKTSQKTNENKNVVEYVTTLVDKEESKSGKEKPELDVKQWVGLFHALTIPGVGSEHYVNNATLHMLSLHPQYQVRIREEVQNTMQKHNTSVLTTEVVQDLHFTKQCIYESVRLMPSTHTLVRSCHEDFRVPGFDYTFRKGDRVIAVPYSVHRDPKYFKNPDTFDPERFSSENKGLIAPGTFLSFGIGPRKCPGYLIGVMMCSTLIASILLKYDIKPHSHLKQMDATDLHPASFHNIERKELLVDFIPLKKVV